MVLSPRMKWKINRYGQDLDRRLEKLRNFFKSVAYKQKMCPACRALVDRKDKVCPFCGENTSGAPRGGAGRVMDRIVPERAATPPRCSASIWFYTASRSPPRPATLENSISERCSVRLTLTLW